MKQSMLVAVAGSGTEKAATTVWSAAGTAAGAASCTGSAAGRAAVQRMNAPDLAKSMYPVNCIFRVTQWSRLGQRDCAQNAGHLHQEPQQQLAEDGAKQQLTQYEEEAPLHNLGRYHQRAMRVQWDQQQWEHLRQQQDDQSKGHPHEQQEWPLHYQQVRQWVQQQKDRTARARRHDLLELLQTHRGAQQHHQRETQLGGGQQGRRRLPLPVGRIPRRRYCGYEEVCSWRIACVLLPLRQHFCLCQVQGRYVTKCRPGDATATAAPSEAVKSQPSYTTAAARSAYAAAAAPAASASAVMAAALSEAARVAPQAVSEGARGTVKSAAAPETEAPTAGQGRRIASPAIPTIGGHAARAACQPSFTAERDKTETTGDHRKATQTSALLRAWGACEKHTFLMRLPARSPALAAAAGEGFSSAGTWRCSVFSRASATARRGGGLGAAKAATADAARGTAVSGAPVSLGKRAPTSGPAATSGAAARGPRTAGALLKTVDYSTRGESETDTSHLPHKSSAWQAAAGGLEGSCASPLPSRFDAAVTPGGWTCFTSAADDTSSSRLSGVLLSCFRRVSALLLCCCGGSVCLYLWVYFSLWRPLREQVGPAAPPTDATRTAAAVAASTTASTSARAAPRATPLVDPAPVNETGLLGPARTDKHAAARATSVAVVKAVQLEPPTAAGSTSTGVRPSKHVPMSLVPLYACSLLQHLGPFLVPLLERSRVCWQALDELEDPFLPREARSACLLALQAMLQTRGVADALICRSSSRSYNSASHDNSTAGAASNSSSRNTSSEGTSSDSGEPQSSLCRMLAIFVRPPPAGVASTSALQSSSDWLAALSCLLRLLDSTPIQRRQVPYELLQRLVNCNTEFWQHRPSLEEVRAFVLMKLLQNKNNCLAVYNREYHELLQPTGAASAYASKSRSRLVLEYLLQQPPAPSVSFPHTQEQPHEATRQPQAEGLLTRLKQRLLPQQGRVFGQTAVQEEQQPTSYRLPSGWLYQCWAVGGRLRAGETHDILRQAIRQINRAVESSAAPSASAASSTSHAAAAGGRGTGTVAATTQAAEGTVSGTGNRGSRYAHTRAADPRTEQQEEAGREQNDSLLPLVPVPDPLPRISPPLHLKQQLQEVELAAACTAAIVLLGLLTRRAAAGEMLPIGNASDIKVGLEVFVAVTESGTETVEQKQALNVAVRSSSS